MPSRMLKFIDRHFSRIFAVLYVLIDYLGIWGAFLLAYVIRRKVDVTTLDLELFSIPSLHFAWKDFVQVAPMIAGLWLVIFIALGMYREIGKTRGLEEFRGIFVAASFGIVAMTVLGFIYGHQPFSRLITLYAYIICIIFVAFGRALLHVVENILWSRQIGVERTIICNIGAIGRQFLEGIRQRGWPGVHIIGVIEEPNKKSQVKVKQLASGPILQNDANTIAGFPILGTVSNFKTIVDQNHPDTLIVGLGGDNVMQEVEPLVQYAREQGIFVMVIPDTLALTAGYKVRETINGVPLMGPRRYPIAGLPGLAKRLTDMFFAALVLVALSPVMLVVAIAVKLTSSGSVIFSQQRIGKNGKPFATYKFRTMHTCCEGENEKAWTTQNDNRRTSIGTFLRASNLDELPQLWNILRGDMTLVGPRPEQPEFVKEFANLIPRYHERHQVTPGLTGWAQVNGWRGNTAIEERLQYDMFYIENWSPWFDLKIILLTLTSFGKSKGAY